MKGNGKIKEKKRDKNKRKGLNVELDGRLRKKRGGEGKRKER